MGYNPNVAHLKVGYNYPFNSHWLKSWHILVAQRWHLQLVHTFFWSLEEEQVSTMLTARGILERLECSEMRLCKPYSKNAHCA